MRWTSAATSLESLGAGLLESFRKHCSLGIFNVGSVVPIGSVFALPAQLRRRFGRSQLERPETSAKMSHL